MDFIDVLFQTGIFVSFIVFGIAVWFIKKDIDKKKKQ